MRSTRACVRPSASWTAGRSSTRSSLRRPTRRSRPPTGASQGRSRSTAVLELDRFEWVRASEAMALLRLEGRWDGGLPEGGVRLAVAAGGEKKIVDPLPDPDAPPGVWRASFPLPFDQAQRAGLAYR